MKRNKMVAQNQTHYSLKGVKSEIEFKVQKNGEKENHVKATLVKERLTKKGLIR